MYLHHFVYLFLSSFLFFFVYANSIKITNTTKIIEHVPITAPMMTPKVLASLLSLVSPLFNDIMVDISGNNNNNNCRN